MESQPRAWAHLHLPRLRSGTTTDVISLKVPGWAIDYVAVVKLESVEFKVHERGRQRCIQENVRNVHAWVVGYIEMQSYGVTGHFGMNPDVWRKALYDPWKGGTFVDSETFDPVTVAAYALLIGKDVFYQGYETRFGKCTCGTEWTGDMPGNHSVAVCAV